MPTSIGEFEVKSEIGRGAMGRVYHAYDSRVGRDVAIKVLTSEGDSDLLARFHSEAGTTGRLTHKNIVTIYAFGEHNGMPYIVMELLPGVDLGRIIRERRPLTMLEKVCILQQAIDGLSYAHQKDVIHRDVKPANILVLPDGTAKIVDFGIARVTGADTTRRTQTGFFLGTIAYMAPEQFKGMDADRLVDIFAFGDVAYQLITGQHPFGDGDPAVVIARITSAEPRPIRELAPDCPEPLASIVHQLLARDRDLRYQSFKDVLLDLEPVLYQLRRDRAAEILKEAHPLVERFELEPALARVKEALELEPMNQEAGRLKAKIQRELRRKATLGKVEALIAEAEQKIAQRSFAEAIEVLTAAQQLDKSETIGARLESVRREQGKVKRAAQMLAEARAEEQRGKVEAAAAKVSEALELDPHNTQAPNLLKRFREELEQRRPRLPEGLAMQAVAAVANTQIANGGADLAVATGLGEELGRRPGYNEIKHRAIFIPGSHRHRIGAQFMAPTPGSSGLAEIDAIGLFCAALSAFSRGAPEAMESRKAREGLIAAARLSEKLQQGTTGYVEADQWQAFLIPLKVPQKQLLMFDDGQQQIQIELDTSHGRARGVWMDHAGSGLGCVLFTVQEVMLRIQFPRPHAVDLSAPKEVASSQARELDALSTTVLRQDPRPLRSTGGSSVLVCELFATAGPQVGTRFALVERTRIGRSSENEVALQDTSVSRLHAWVERNSAGYWIADNQSLNGVIVNGVRIAEPTRLTIGDRVRICETEFVFQVASAAAAQGV